MIIRKSVSQSSQDKSVSHFGHGNKINSTKIIYSSKELGQKYTYINFRNNNKTKMAKN